MHVRTHTHTYGYVRAQQGRSPNTIPNTVQMANHLFSVSTPENLSLAALMIKPSTYKIGMGQNCPFYGLRW